MTERIRLHASAFAAHCFMNRGPYHRLMSLPDTPTAPRFLLANGGRTVFVDTEGGMCLLHPERLNALDPIRTPFPGDITNAVLLGDNLLISTWVEREISLARLAALDLNQPIEDGVELPDLRAAIESGKIDHYHVSGAKWSHILDAEPLALCTYKDDLIFCTHHRGIYRVTATSEEVWRRNPIEWDSLVDLPDGEVIVELVTSDDSIWAFSLGGGWAEINATDGSVLRSGILQLKSKINRVWSSGTGVWLFGLSHNRMVYWDPADDSILIENVQGPIQDAVYQDGIWSITGWREDIVWSPAGVPSLSSSARSEIGHSIVNRGEEGLWVLDNRGQWTPFGTCLN